MIAFTLFYVASDLFELGRNEFNEQITAESFYVVGESVEGYRIQHRNRFPNASRVRTSDPDCEQGWYIEPDFNAEDKARLLLRRITDHVAAGGTINREHWETVDPAYGSEAYQREGIEELRAFNDRFDD